MKSKQNLPQHLLRKEHKNHPSHNNHLIPMMSCTAIASIAASVGTIAHLEPDAKISVNRGLLLFTLGSAFFTSFFNLTNQVVRGTAPGQKLVKRFKLTTSDVYDISNKVVSAVQAIFSCITGLVICTYSCPRDLLRASHHVSHAYSWFGASYFFYDIWSMYKIHAAADAQHGTSQYSAQTPAVVSSSQSSSLNGDSHAISPATNGEKENNNLHNILQRPRRGIAFGVRAFLTYMKVNPIIVGHHLFIGIFGFSVIIYLKGNLGDCVFGFVFLMEASTPFVSFRTILSRFDLKKSKTYIWNGFAMLLVFFLCRIAMFPYVMHMYAKAAHLGYLQAVYSLPTGCKVSIAVLMFPQFYWFYLMVKGATKILVAPKVAPQSTVAQAKQPSPFPSNTVTTLQRQNSVKKRSKVT